MSFRSAACALILVSLALPAAAQVHRWVDEHGRVHYGDRPLGAQTTRLRIRAESATAPAGNGHAAVPSAVTPAPAQGGPSSRTQGAPSVDDRRAAPTRLATVAAPRAPVPAK